MLSLGHSNYNLNLAADMAARSGSVKSQSETNESSIVPLFSAELVAIGVFLMMVKYCLYLY